jgi:hypothetical protein
MKTYSVGTGLFAKKKKPMHALGGFIIDSGGHGYQIYFWTEQKSWTVRLSESDIMEIEARYTLVYPDGE